jgi:hypothetical protein
MSSVATNLQEVNAYIKAEFTRFIDRGCKKSFKKDLEDEDDDEVLTKKKNQEELDQLYTGEIFLGEKTFSRMMSTFFVIITYSSGMPVLYLVGILFFVMTYAINKVLIFRFYQKSLTLNRVVPLKSMEFLSTALFMHMIIGSFMLTNPTLFKTETEPEKNILSNA